MKRDNLFKIWIKGFGLAVFGNILGGIMTISIAPFLGEWFVPYIALLLTAFICWLAVSWVRFYADMLRDESEEHAEEIAEERFQAYIDNAEFRVDEQRYIGLGKGFK